MFVITQHQPANRDEFLEQIQAMTEQLSKEPGFIRLSVTRSVDEPNNWKIVQDPKLILLQRYVYQGPYYSREEASHV